MMKADIKKIILSLFSIMGIFQNIRPSILKIARIFKIVR